MSSLRTKLDRLGAAGPGSRPAAPSVMKEPEPPAVVETPAAADAVTVDEPQQKLEWLRQKIADIVARNPPAPRPPADPSHGELPFFVQQTEAGPLYIRRLRFELTHRVGRFPVWPARHACMPMLSLLALDPSLAELSSAGALYLDTETTGLSGGTGTLPFLIGVGFFMPDGGALQVEQLLLRRPGEEGPILMHLTELMRQSSLLVTFNGKAFDMPLVRTRYVMNRLGPAPALPHLDLLHIARRVHKSRIKTCTLGMIESKVLGFGRVNDVPSGEVSARYAHFLRTGEEGALLGVIEHNAWDVVSMVALLGLYGEPLDGMEGEDLAGVAATLQRARCSEKAAEFAEEAVARGGGSAALHTRAKLAKARGDRDRALADFEALVQQVDDPAVRLELAKLYEHHLKTPYAALALVEQGVSESSEAAERRQARLRRKVSQQEKPPKKRKSRARRPVNQPLLPGFEPEPASEKKPPSSRS